MAKHCKHRLVRPSIWTGECWSISNCAIPLSEAGAADAIVCAGCGDWLPLGQSDDDPESVRTEILAAFLVANANAFVNVAHKDWHHLEACDEDGFAFREDCIGCQGEYLAWEVIAKHEPATARAA